MSERFPDAGTRTAGLRPQQPTVSRILRTGNTALMREHFADHSDEWIAVLAGV